MDETLRLFVGLRVGPAARAPLAREAARWAREDAALRPTPEPDLHLTLAFLGATAPSRVPALGAALAPIAARHAPLPVSYLGLGAFPSRQRAHVLWVGVESEPASALALLAGDVHGALRTLGMRLEERPFHAHVTLARVRRGAPLASSTCARLEQGAGRTLGSDRLSVLKIMVSLADPVGYAYNDLTDLPLRGAP
jgi:2'-5' RNA ligase